MLTKEESKVKPPQNNQVISSLVSYTSSSQPSLSKIDTLFSFPIGDSGRFAPLIVCVDFFVGVASKTFPASYDAARPCLAGMLETSETVMANAGACERTLRLIRGEDGESIGSSRSNSELAEGRSGVQPIASEMGDLAAPR